MGAFCLDIHLVRLLLEFVLDCELWLFTSLCTSRAVVEGLDLGVPTKNLKNCLRQKNQGPNKSEPLA